MPVDAAVVRLRGLFELARQALGALRVVVVGEVRARLRAADHQRPVRRVFVAALAVQRTHDPELVLVLDEAPLGLLDADRVSPASASGGEHGGAEDGDAGTHARNARGSRSGRVCRHAVTTLIRSRRGTGGRRRAAAIARSCGRGASRRRGAGRGPR
ncbi:MAG: hypothetical protein AVDCRST_MAG85-2895 [uncultured Solirubrobacteraceae bacterium]|uniref:Uncharacterized protein n=1 Tax=uncultured Solirubrobacteraceae bacterium TaxID=1162706 RepID=A0A6J4TF51_9ACTN|nr:MAG: hypothetical protein AVDCRST_MAG85-2895 [uncultured Solirubrobacteraceae bacterium]